MRGDDVPDDYPVSPSRQQWEFLSLRADSWADVAACGDNGWELVTVILESPNDKGSRVYFFKRPKL